MLPKLRFIGLVLRLLYLILELLLSPLRLLRLSIAFLLRHTQWGRANWAAFNIDTAAAGWGRMYMMVSAIAHEGALEGKPRYVMFERFIDMCSEKGHCQKAYGFAKAYSLDADEAFRDAI